MGSVLILCAASEALTNSSQKEGQRLYKKGCTVMVKSSQFVVLCLHLHWKTEQAMHCNGFALVLIHAKNSSNGGKTAAQNRPLVALNTTSEYLFRKRAIPPLFPLPLKEILFMLQCALSLPQG